MAARIGTTADARQLVADERIGRRLDDGNHETGERIARGHETPDVPAIRIGVETACASAAAEHTVDLDDGIFAHLVLRLSAFGQRPECGAYPPGVHQSCRGRSRLQHGAPANPRCALLVDGRLIVQPGQQRLEIAQQITAGHLRGSISVDEVEPKARSRRHRAGKSVTRFGPPRIGGGNGHMVAAVGQRLLVYVAASKLFAGYFLTFLLP